MTTAQKPDALPVVAHLLEESRRWKARALTTKDRAMAEREAQARNDGSTVSALVRLSDAQASFLAKEVDTDRLDWMDKNPGRIKHSIGYRGTPDSWVWTDGNGYGHDAANLRAAIDAARAAADQGGA